MDIMHNLKEYFRQRRSVRAFADRPVEQSLLCEIVEQAAKAPTTGNMQLYSVVSTAAPDRRAALSALHFNQPAATGAPLLLTVCADLHRFERWCGVSDAKPGLRNLQGYLYAFFDAVIFAQQIATIAELSGLGTCYLGTTAFNAPEIAGLLELPDGVVPLLTLAVGYPAEKGEATERIALSGILHSERYSKFTDGQIREIYAPKDCFPANASFVAEHNKDTLAQVFTDVRYPRAMNEEFSAKLSGFLARQGLSCHETPTD